MIKATIIFDNTVAAPIGPEEFVKRYYLKELGNNDLVYISVKQESFFEELKK